MILGNAPWLSHFVAVTARNVVKTGLLNSAAKFAIAHSQCEMLLRIRIICSCDTNAALRACCDIKGKMRALLDIIAKLVAL